MAKTEEKTDGRAIVVSTIKEYLNKKGMQAGEEFIEKLNGKVFSAIDNAIKRADANGRKRPKAVDL